MPDRKIIDEIHKISNMKTMTIKPELETEFFNRGRVIAKLADAGSTLPEHCVISFYDPSELLKLLSTRLEAELA